MLRGFSKYKMVYRHLWRTYGARWQVRVSFMMQIAVRIARLIVQPIAISLIIARLSSHNFNGARQAALLFIAVTLVFGIISPLIKYIGMLGENKTYDELTGQYFARLVSADLDYFNSNMTGYLTTATRQYVDSSISMVRSIRDTYLPTVLSIVFPIMVIIWLDWWLGIVALALSILQAAYLLWASSAITPLRTKSREMYKRNSGQMSDVISNVLAVRSAAQERTYVRRVKTGAYEEAQMFNKRYSMQAKLIMARELLGVAFFTALLLLTVQFMSAGSIRLTTAILVVTYMTTILTGIYTLSDNLDEHDDLVDKIIPAFDILERQNQVRDPKQPKTLRRVRGDIRFQHVYFSYKEQNSATPVFVDFSLHIPAGQKVGVVGLSGAGKSTLTKLLLRFSDVDSGEITMDGVDIRTVRQTDLRRHLAYVPQEPLLFHASVQDNILLARPNASEEAVQEALRAAHAARFVELLPNGINSIVGERGVKLSGGQKQRIAIARAVLQDAPIMIFDEATSALDSESEKIIKDSFLTILRGRTAIVVAHRLSTLSEMDRIIVIEHGKLGEDGTHAELLSADGVYARLWRRQQNGLDEQGIVGGPYEEQALVRAA